MKRKDSAVSRKVIEAMKRKGSAALRFAIVDDMGGSLAYLQTVYDTVDWDSVDSRKLANVHAKLDDLFMDFADIAVDKNTKHKTVKLKPE